MTHIHEKIDFTVAVMIVHKNKVLLRMHDKYNIWLTPGGHVELDEDPIQAVYREAKEETGLDIRLWEENKKFESPDGSELIPPVGLNRHHTSPDHEHINLMYLATTETDVLNPAADEKQDGFKWCAKEDLVAMDLRPDIKFYAELALDTLGE